ncbi:MAG: thioredoxin, partial [Pseudomonadota bacterium]
HSWFQEPVFDLPPREEANGEAAPPPAPPPAPEVKVSEPSHPAEGEVDAEADGPSINRWRTDCAPVIA